jgi:8-oxo-dGTP pyrophosphatase MutT (NUDIX family)
MVTMRTLNTRVVYDSPWMTIREDDVERDDGERSRFGVVVRAPFIAVLAWAAEDQILLVRQFRYAVRQWLWEIPQGARHPREDPIDAAVRETREETGWRLVRPVLLASGLPEAGDWATQTFDIVAATAVPSTDGPSQEPSESSLRSRAAPVAEVHAMMLDGRLVDPPSLCALQLWQAHKRSMDDRCATW